MNEKIDLKQVSTRDLVKELEQRALSFDPFVRIVGLNGGDVLEIKANHNVSEDIMILVKNISIGHPECSFCQKKELIRIDDDNDNYCKYRLIGEELVVNHFDHDAYTYSFPVAFCHLCGKPIIGGKKDASQ